MKVGSKRLFYLKKQKPEYFDKISSVARASLSRLVSKDNKISTAIIAGSVVIAIVIFISGINKTQPSSPSGLPDTVPGVPYWDDWSDKTRYSCPDGYRGGLDAWCYKK